MKSIYKKLIVGFVGTVLLAVTIYAAVTTAPLWMGTGSRANIATGNLLSTSFTFQNTNTTANATVYIFDAPGTNDQIVYLAYSNYVQSVAYYTNIYTNYYGAYESNVYLSTFVITNSIPQATNSRPLIAIYTIPSNSAPAVGFLTVPLAYRFQNGVLVTNATTPVTTSMTFGQ